MIGALAMSATVQSRAQERRPNILFIMVDDLGKEWISCYGAEGIQTPHVDRLAETGMRFENVYCMPQCTPTRLTLLTGQYPFRHGWVNHWDVPRWGGGASFDPHMNPSLPRNLRQAGYTTAAAGKWQIDDFRQEPMAMREAGFDAWCMWTGYEAGYPPSAERYHDPYVFSGEESRTREGGFGPDVFTDFLIDFMKAHRDEPMFLYFPMVLTHGPLVATPGEPDAEGTLGRHRAMVRHMDTLVGRLVDALDELGLRDDTLIFWTTDNGTDRGITGRRHGRSVRGGKSMTAETGVCVPFIVSGPGRVPQGVGTEALVDFTDLLPTFCELAGGKPPREHVIDGHSFASLILGEVDDSARDWIFAMGGRNEAKLTAKGVQNRWRFRDRVIRDKRFKLYIGTDARPERLIDLQSDPSEETNLLSAASPEAQQALDRLYARIRQQPAIDADPRYAPLESRGWYRNVETEADSWKEGEPAFWK